MAKKFEIGEFVWYRVKSDDIRKGIIRDVSEHVNNQTYYLITGSEFWYKPEQIKKNREDFEE